MNTVQTIVALTATVVTILGSAVGGVYTLEHRMDSKYVPVEQYKDFQWAFYKRELRDLRDLIEEEENYEMRRRYEEDYDDLLDRFCMSYPDARECK